MIVRSRDGREIEITEIDYGSEPGDTFIVAAYYMDEFDDDAAMVPEHVLDELQEDYAGELAEQWMEHQVGRADFYDQD